MYTWHIRGKTCISDDCGFFKQVNLLLSKNKLKLYAMPLVPIHAYTCKLGPK